MTSTTSTTSTPTPTPLQRHAGQQAEYTALSSALHDVKSHATSLGDFYFSPRSHSPLSIEHGRARNRWQSLLTSPGDNELSKYLRTVEGRPTEIDSIGEQCVISGTLLDGSGTTYKISDTEKLLSSVQSFQRAILSIGGHLRSDSLLPLPQVLKFYGLSVPARQTEASLVRLTEEIEEKRAIHRLNLEQGTPLGTLIDPSEHYAVSLIISELLGGEAGSVIERLIGEVKPALTAHQLQTTPTACLAAMLDTPTARDTGQRLLKTLNWYGAAADEPTAPDTATRLVLEALRIWYELTPAGAPQSIVGYDLQNPANHGRSYAGIRKDFLQHLMTSARATTPTEQALLGRLCVPWFPIEFQVRDIPPDLPYCTSPVWVNFVHGVHLAQTLDPGLLQRLTFQQLVDLPLKRSADATEAELQLITLTRIPAAMRWAAATGATVTDSPGTAPRDNQLEAIKALDAHNTQLNQTIVQLSLEPPQRLQLAKEQLKGAMSHDLWAPRTSLLLNVRLMRTAPRTTTRSTRALIDGPDVPQPHWPLPEVYASGGLTPGTKWYVTTNGRTASEWISLNAANVVQTGTLASATADNRSSVFPKNCTLPDIGKLFDQRFTNYLTKTRAAYEHLIKCQLATLPWEDRQALEHGQIQILTLRKATRLVPALLENAKNRLPFRVRMGFVLQVTCGPTVRFIECIPRAGVIRPRPDLNKGLKGGRFTPALEPQRGRTRAQLISRFKARPLPFDWKAHEQGTKPAPDARCVGILDALNDTPELPHPLPVVHLEMTHELTLSSARCAAIASYIAHHWFYTDEAKMREDAFGVTAFERDKNRKHWLHSIKPFIPFWGSLEDLMSDQYGDRVMGAIGLLIDIVSFGIPLGKFAAGSIRLAVQAGRMSIRATIPGFTKLSRKFLADTLKNLNPLDGLPDLVRLSARGVKSAGRAVAALENQALFQLKKLAGRADDYDLLSHLPQATSPGRWQPLNHADRLAVIKGIEDVPVRRIGGPGNRHFLVDPLSGQPFGPALTTERHQVSFGRSHYSPLKKTDEEIFVELADDSRVHLLLEVDGRSTVFIDDVPYRLDGDELRRVDMLDDSRQWTLPSCRPRRMPGSSPDCLASYVTGEPAPTPAIGSVDKTKGYAPWFGDRLSTPAPLPNQRGEFMAVDSKLYSIIDGRSTLFRGDLARLGLTGGRLVPKRQINATLQFRKGIYARLDIGATYDHLNDSHRVGAIMLPAIDDSASYVFFRVNTQEYYQATIKKGQVPGNQLSFTRLLPADMADGTLGAELLTVYTGSLNANNIVRIHGLEAVERAMKTMEDLAIPLGTSAHPPANLKWLKVDTSPGEALMFDHSTRMIVTRLPNGASSWTRSKEAPQAFRLRTAEIFDTLFLSPTVPPKNTDAALRIDQSMQKLHNLLPRYERPLNARNIAYAEVTTVSGQREVYVSVSGTQGTTTRLPLFRHLGANHVRIGDTTYINIDYSSSFPKTSLTVTPQGQLLAVPLTIKDIDTYRPAMSARPTSLDSESKLIQVIREKYPDPKELRSVDVATTMRPCESCAVVMKEFGHDGSAGALQVLWS